MTEANQQNVSAASCLPPVVAPDWRSLFNEEWPEAQWDVSGAFTFDTLFINFHDFILEKTKRKLLSQVHGAPTCRWNGGRLKSNLIDQDKIGWLIQNYSDRGIAVHATFTNYNITESMLSDSLGNLILDSLHQHNRTGNNGVILCEPVLADYVRANYPELKIIASITKIAKDNGRGKLDYYRSLEASYDRIMIHPDDNLRPELLAQLEDKEKYEILVNEPCACNCQYRVFHYQMLSDRHTQYLDYSLSKRLLARLNKNTCEDIGRLASDPNARVLILNAAELKGLYDLGFRHFKMQGRGMADEQGMAFELSRWLFTHNPDFDYLVPRLMMAFMSPPP
jgi:hypothetical protein